MRNSRDIVFMTEAEKRVTVERFWKVTHSFKRQNSRTMVINIIFNTLLLIWILDKTSRTADTIIILHVSKK